MIIQEVYGIRPDGKELVRAYSDNNKFIRKIGTYEMYEEAVDILPARFEYEETDVDIEAQEALGADEV